MKNRTWYMVIMMAGLWCGGNVAAQTNTVIDAKGKPLEIELYWSNPVDLDLFVTAPDGETIYYGNPKSRAGDHIMAQSNCEGVKSDTAPWRERARIKAAQNGRYRVSVDFIFDCGSALKQADAMLTLIDPKTKRQIANHVIKVEKQILNTIAWEFEVGEK